MAHVSWHYKRAEELLKNVGELSEGKEGFSAGTIEETIKLLMSLAQVHATLALYKNFSE